LRQIERKKLPFARNLYIRNLFLKSKYDRIVDVIFVDKDKFNIFGFNGK